MRCDVGVQLGLAELTKGGGAAVAGLWSPVILVDADSRTTPPRGSMGADVGIQDVHWHALCRPGSFCVLDSPGLKHLARWAKTCAGSWVKHQSR